MQVLRFLYEGGYLNKLELPIATASRRYLLAREPKHPKGHRFFKPVEYKGYYMESYKSLDAGFHDLRKLLNLCGLSMQFVD